jgi:hypothetical protein
MRSWSVARLPCSEHLPDELHVCPASACAGHTGSPLAPSPLSAGRITLDELQEGLFQTPSTRALPSAAPGPRLLGSSGSFGAISFDPQADLCALSQLGWAQGGDAGVSEGALQGQEQQRQQEQAALELELKV